MEKLSYQDVKKQSTAVFGQFGESKWIPFAKENAKHPNRRDPMELQNCGVGKVLLAVGFGASVEDHLETIKKYRDRVDIICPDKAFKPLMDRGIKPDYVMLCDCNIMWPKWGPDESLTKDIKLLSTAYGNTMWTRRWQGPIYFYVNRDAIGSEKVFLDILGSKTRAIPASSNVSNAQVVFLTGMDEWTQSVFAGYDKILLTGYDYSWRPDGNYYAWSDPKPKRYYMQHRTLRDINSDRVFSSENLIFSARWLSTYLKSFNLNAVNCSERGLLDIKRGSLESEMSSINPAAGRKVRLALETVKFVSAARESALTAFNMAREELCYGSR
jgi:hypothetical protein